jgi:hypothetical protein
LVLVVRSKKVRNPRSSSLAQKGIVVAPRDILSKREAEKLRKYRLVPVANAGASFKPFVMGADGTLLGLQAAEIMMVMAKNVPKEWKLRDQVVHVTGGP